MPSLELTVEDNSPIISYSSNWIPGASADSLMDRYSQNSFTLTNKLGESASFSFNGTGIQIFGAKRGNHGPYHVNIDNGPSTALNGTAADPGEFQTSLYSVSGLQQGLHQVTVTNDADTYIDIDFITWQTTLGEENDRITVNTFQDADPSFAYLPSVDTWSTNPDRLGSFSGGSGHATNTSGASFTYTFQGEGVSLYGPVGLNGSSYGVQLDGRAWATMSSSKEFYVPQTLLYHANNLEAGQHSLQLQCQSASSKEFCAIDYAQVYTTSSSSTGVISQTTNTMSNGTVAGIAVAGVVSLFILLGLLGFLYHRRARGLGTKADIPSNQQNPNSSVFARSDTTARPVVGSQMTTVPNPFYLSSPNPPSQDDGPSNQNSPKGYLRFPSFPRVLQDAPTSSESSDTSFPNPLNPISRDAQPRYLNPAHTPFTPGESLPPGYSV